MTISMIRTVLLLLIAVPVAAQQAGGTTDLDVGPGTKNVRHVERDFREVRLTNPDCRYRYDRNESNPLPDLPAHHYEVALNTFTVQCASEKVTSEEEPVNRAACLRDQLGELDSRIEDLRTIIGDRRLENCAKTPSCPHDNEARIRKIVEALQAYSLRYKDADTIARTWSNIDRGQVDALIESAHRALDDSSVLLRIAADIDQLCGPRESSTLIDANASDTIFATPHYPFRSLPVRSWKFEVDAPKTRVLLGLSGGAVFASQRDDSFGTVPEGSGYRIVASHANKPFHTTIALAACLTPSSECRKNFWPLEIIIVPGSTPAAIGIGSAWSYGRVKANAGVLFARERELIGARAGDVISAPLAPTRLKTSARIYLGISLLAWKGR